MIVRTSIADCPASHEDALAPEFLGVLRIGDLPHNLALACPRPISFVGKMPEAYAWTRQLYETLGACDCVPVIGSVRMWRPRRSSGSLGPGRAACRPRNGRMTTHRPVPAERSPLTTAARSSGPAESGPGVSPAGLHVIAGSAVAGQSNERP